MATIIVDGERYEAKAGQNVLEAVLSQHLDLPYFCWHPAMGSVGACRQCAIMEYADENDDRGRLVMACITSVARRHAHIHRRPPRRPFPRVGHRVADGKPPARLSGLRGGGRVPPAGHDGHDRPFRAPLSRHETDLAQPGPGPVHRPRDESLHHLLSRCVRFYRDYAGGTDLEAMGSRSRMYFGRAADGKLENEFSGNLVEVCPTGVFTDKPFSRHYTRKWDLQSAPSVCPGVRGGLQHLSERALRRSQTRSQPLSRRNQRLFSL